MSEGKKRGAPLKDPALRRTEKVVVLLTKSELEQVRAEAKASHLRVNEYARRMVLGKPPMAGPGERLDDE